MTSDRFARQRLLAEVGERGQQLFAEAKVRVLHAPGADVAADYLRRAGFGDVSVSPPDEPTSEVESDPSFPHATCFRHAPSAELARGAWRALDEIRAVLQLGASPLNPRP